MRLGNSEGVQVGVAPGAAAPPEQLELDAQVVQEQRLDDLEDVRFGCVVAALDPLLRGLHHRLEQRAEDRRRDRGPVETAGVEQGLTHSGVELRNRQGLGEQIAVDVGEAGEVLVQRCLASVLGRVEHLEQARQPAAEVAAVRRGALFEEFKELVAGLEDAGVVGEEAEHRPHQEQLQVVAAVTGLAQTVVEPGHQLGGLGVDRVLVAERAALDAQDEAELLDVSGQLGEREARLLAFVEVEQFEVLKIAHQQVAGPLVLRESVEVGHCLSAGRGEIPAGALLLDEQHARPEQVDEALGVVEPLDVLLVAGDAAPLDAEDPEESVVEALRLALLVAGVRPLAGELGGTGADLVPGESHRRRISVAATPCRSPRRCRGVRRT